jgi:hypothetical protein
VGNSLTEEVAERAVLDENAKVSGAAAFAIKVRRKGNNDVTLYFDKDTSRLVKSKRRFYHIGNNKEGELETFYRNFKSVQGAIVPHRMVVYHDGNQFSVEQITQILVLSKVADSEFDIEE